MLGERPRCAVAPQAGSAGGVVLLRGDPSVRGEGITKAIAVAVAGRGFAAARTDQGSGVLKRRKW